MAQALVTSSSLTTKTFSLGAVEHTVRIVGTHEDPWFVAADIGKVLGISSMGEYLKGYKEGAERDKEDFQTPSGVQRMIILSEKAVYKFLMRSQKKEAEPFQDWVADVLKSIRLKRHCELQFSSQKLIEDAETARLAAERQATEMKRELEDQEKQAAEMKRQLEKKNSECEKLKREAGNKHHRGHCIYLLRNPADRSRNLTKIGRTQDLSMRETSYHTGMPDGVDILHCCHTSDSKLAEQLVHHALKEYRYDDNREWFQGDPELFAHTIDFVTSVVDNLPLLIENMVSSRVRDRVRKELVRATRFHEEREEGDRSDASAGSGVVVNTTVNVTVENPAQEAVRRYIAEELARERNAWIDYVMLSADLRDWCKSKGHEEVLDWRRRDIIEGLNKEEIRIRGKRIPDPETSEVIMRTGAYGWRFTDDKKPAFSKAPSKEDKDAPTTSAP